MSNDFEARLAQAKTAIARLREAIGQVIVGQADVVDQVMWTLAAGGHVLLEGAPGLGKTLLVRTLAQCLDLRFSRIQFTPDLMPSDVVGTNVLVMDATQRSAGSMFQLQRGPIFGQVVLADEINRATPKTQSALLEAMAEHAVTIAGPAARAGRAVLRARHREPHRDGGHLPPARGAARSVPAQGRRAQSDRGRAVRRAGAHDGSRAARRRRA